MWKGSYAALQRYLFWTRQSLRRKKRVLRQHGSVEESVEDGLQIWWWTSAHPLYTERHEIGEGTGSAKGAECCRRAARGGVMQNAEKLLENLNRMFVQTSIVLCCSI